MKDIVAAYRDANPDDETEAEDLLEQAAGKWSLCGCCWIWTLNFRSGDGGNTAVESMDSFLLTEAETARLQLAHERLGLTPKGALQVIVVS
eukprot:CAMPEP_0183517850 /NCGR_PEP_ID=MMETSP0371-20130417/15149_1 /TAXON_ID=268820 /ORGANISM="Peridinium aciculiferum, Strain PAER-2" /LENGTH=90 /DNA_ID=CAMNT_0025715817 /DNA_START=41 /DNA_END=313 /DNA_ORIENTATION=+